MDGTVSDKVAAKCRREQIRVEILGEAERLKPPDLLNDMHKLADRHRERDDLQEASGAHRLDGYVRRIQTDPFAFSLFSPLQIRAYINICRQNHVSEVRAHFDGTGQILNMRTSEILQGAGTHLLYSLILHTDSRDIDFSVFDVFLTAHSENDVSGPLAVFIAACRARSSVHPRFGLPRPGVAVTDQSIQCMKAVCMAFNGFSIPVYNQLAWRMVQGRMTLKEILSFTRLSNCAAHSMKNASRHMERSSPLVARFFMAAFACVIDTVTMTELDQLLTDIILLFGAA